MCTNDVTDNLLSCIMSNPVSGIFGILMASACINKQEISFGEPVRAIPSGCS